MSLLTHLDLFSGIGGFALAARWAGFETIGFCEIEPYAQRVLAKNFGAAVLADAGCEREGSGRKAGQRAPERAQPETSRPSIHPDIHTLDGSRYRNVTLITGGFPCQPFSCAGKRRGKADHRALWPEMLRVISQARPAWVVGENVAGIINMELDSVLADLEGIGYAAWPLVIPACAVDAPHRRSRVWILAADTRHDDRAQQGCEHEGTEVGKRSGANGLEAGDDLAHPHESRPQGREREELSERAGERTARSSGASTANPNSESAGRTTEPRQEYSEWLPEPAVGRVANGIPAALDISGLVSYILRYGSPNQAKMAEEIAASSKDKKVRMLRLYSEVAKAPRQLEVPPKSSGAVPEMPRSSGLSERQVGTGPEKKEALLDLPPLVSTERFAPPQNVQPETLPVDIGEAERWLKVGNRVERLKGLGNSIVPQVAYEILRGIRDIEDAANLRF